MKIHKTEAEELRSREPSSCTLDKSAGLPICTRAKREPEGASAGCAS